MSLTILIAVCSFLLGWMTCSMTYFYRSTRLSIILIKMSHVFYLTLITKGLESLYYAHINKLSALRDNGKSYDDVEYKQAKIDHDKLTQLYKDNSIAYLVKAHPDLFKQLLDFDDWWGAQRFLNNNKSTSFMFSKEKDND